MSFEFLICILVVVIFVIPGIIVVSAVRKELTFNRKGGKYKHTAFLGNDFKVNLREFNEIRKLEKMLPHDTNRFCKQQSIILYFTIQRVYDLQPEQCKRAIVRLCEVAILQELDFDKLDLAFFSRDYMRQLDNPEVCQAITAKATEQISQINWEDENLYKCTDAWEIYYYHLQRTFKPEHIQQYYEKVCWLSKCNSSIIARRKIYLDAFQFLVNIDREYSLKLYLYYLHVSIEIKHRKISARNSKVLFKSQGEKERFDMICADLLRHRRLPKALELFDRIGISQRKKISLNIEAIKTAAEKQSKVADVLGEWLADEEVPVPVNIPKKNVEENSTVKPQENPKDALFQLFINHSYRINKEEVDIFARSHGLFTSQFVERINDEHFEQLDDVLIEEDEEYYTLNEAYYRQIKENGD